jgi:hypothetical protein
VRTFASAVAHDKENFPPKTPVGVNAEVSLANSDKNSKVENRVWGQLPKLNAVREKKAAEELVGWERQPTIQESRKHDDKAIGRLWVRDKPGWMKSDSSEEMIPNVLNLFSSCFEM